MRYIDGYVLPVPKKNLAAYKRLAKKMSKVFLKHGALEYVEAVADDVKKGKWTSFPQSVKLKAGEVVVFAYVIYKSRAHRDKAMKKTMNDPIAKKMEKTAIPFDGKRMFWGGFKTFI